MNIVKQCFAYDVDELKVVYKDVYDYAREKCKNKASDLRYELGLPIFTPSSLHLAMYCALPLLIRSMIVRRSICAISKRMVQMSEVTGLTLPSSVRVSSLI